MNNEPSSIADRLAAARHGRFVGRRSEVELFHSALTADEPPFVVLHIYGPGGIGKTTLLREFERMTAENGRATLRLDGRHLDPSPTNFLLALESVISKQISVNSKPTTGQRLSIANNSVLFILDFRQTKVKGGL